MNSRVAGAVEGLLSAAHVLSEAAPTSPEARAAVQALHAAATLVLGHVRPLVVPGAREAAVADLKAAVAALCADDVGTTTLPDRYDTGDRETLDRIRDLIGDDLYVGGCLFNVVKYLDRRGKKGPADRDDDKAVFYLQAAGHVLLGCLDPRHRRPGFQPYRRSISSWPSMLLDVAGRVDGVDAPATWTQRLLFELARRGSPR